MKHEYKISICMMVKNEEKNLIRCLDKLKPLIETNIAELIIIDTGSKDSTVTIAEGYTDKIYFHNWNNNFSKMRNKSISYAKGEWIFIIDADERLDNTQELINLLKSGILDKYNTVQINVKNLYDSNDENKHNLSTSPRLFRNDGSFEYVGAVHNQPIFKEPILNCNIFLTHFGYVSNDKILMENKFNRTKELLMKELEKDSKNLYYMYQLGVSYDMHEDYELALNQFRKSYSLLSKKTIIEKKQYIYILAAYANSAYINSKFEEAIKIAKETINLNNEYVDMYYIIGICEKHIGNMEDFFTYLCRYLKLANSYNNLQVSKNNSIAMYYINKNFISNVYFEICKYYLSDKKYIDAYEIYNNIISINEKIYISINVLIPLGKYLELRKVYNSLLLTEDKNTFLCTLEEEEKKLEEIEKKKLYKEFSLNEDLYGLLNKVRITSNIEEKISLTKLLINEIDFSKEPKFYIEVFENLKEHIELMIDIFKDIEAKYLKDIVQYLVEEKEFKEKFENYILLNNEDLIHIEEMKVFISITNTLILINIKMNNDVNKKYLDIFKKYINVGISFVTELYKIEKAEKIYKNINSQEDKFFIIMYIINKLLREKNIKLAIKYMIEAVNSYEPMVKYIDLYKDEIFNLQEEKNLQVENTEFENYKLKIKNTISDLVNNGLLEEAKALICEYEDIVKTDIDIYSMKSIIFILENKLEEAELFLNEGLNIDNNSFDLNYNLAYLYEQKGMYLKAIEIYRRLVIGMEDCEQRQQIIKCLEKLESIIEK